MRVEPLARLSDLAYERLRDSIIELEIEPGSPIDEEQVRERYSLGLTPIRDALKRLSHERLVTIYPRRGTFATEINIADDQWISEIRAELEGLAAELATERATPQEKILLVELASQMRKTTTTDEFVTVDAQFHRTLYQAAHNPLLEANLTQYFNLSLRIWHFSIRNFSRENFLQDDFDVLATAITNGDAGLARKTARHHIEYSRLVVRNMGMRIDPSRPTGT